MKHKVLLPCTLELKFKLFKDGGTKAVGHNSPMHSFAYLPRSISPKLKICLFRFPFGKSTHFGGKRNRTKHESNTLTNTQSVHQHPGVNLVDGSPLVFNLRSHLRNLTFQRSVKENINLRPSAIEGEVSPGTSSMTIFVLVENHDMRRSLVFL